MYLAKLYENFIGEIIFLQNKHGFYPLKIHDGGSAGGINNCRQFYNELYLAVLAVEREFEKQLEHIYITVDNDPISSPDPTKILTEANCIHYIPDDKYLPFSKRIIVDDDPLMPETD